MAYRKKTAPRKRRATAKRSTSRRRRIGAVSSRRVNIARVAGIIVGSVLPILAGNIKIGGEPIKGKIVGAASLAAGYFLPNFVKGDLVSGIGDGLLASGSVILLTEFNVLSGIPVISGWKDMKAINGTTDPASSMRNLGQETTFRPSVSQMLNGIYNRYPNDGTYD